MRFPFADERKGAQVPPLEGPFAEPEKSEVERMERVRMSCCKKRRLSVSTV